MSEHPPLTGNPPRRVVPDEVAKAFMAEMNKTEAFTQQDAEWVESVLSREDGTDGFRQMTQPFVFNRADQSENLYEMCKRFNKNIAEMSEVERFEGRTILQHLLWSKRVSMYRQKKILVAAPQRKRHPKYDAPNVYNWEGAGQHVNTQILAVYGLDYVEARTQCVKTALSDADATHILFVDDDVQLPKNFAQVLVDTGLPSVAGVYCKKTTLAQTNATTSGEDGEFIFNQKLLDPIQDAMTPVPASCVGGGMWLINLDVFRQLPEPWFAMVSNGHGHVRIGEDSLLVQKLAAYGVKTHVIPGLVGVHTDFSNGKQYGPSWLVDPIKLKLRPEFAPHYHPFPDDLNLADLVAPDVRDFFAKNVKMVEQGLLTQEEVTAFESQHKRAG